MLLLQQVGSVKIGEVVRYTVTYTPSHDRILPSPSVLHLRIRNTSAIALRAAFVHGPYSLDVSAYPAHFDPNVKFEDPRKYGVPEFEPMLKAGGSWTCQLTVPEDIRESAGLGASHGHFGSGREWEENTSVSWVIEVASQVIFSSSAAVGYELLVARDEKSLHLGSAPVLGGSQAQVPQPGRVSDFQQSIGAKDGHHPAQLKGVFSRAVTLKVEDTASLWNTPRLPGSEDWTQGHPNKHHGMGHPSATEAAGPPRNADKEQLKNAKDEERVKSGEKKPKKIHLVVITHGLHSNLGADMLYLKESIDATVKQARIDAKERRKKEKAEREAKRRENLAQGLEDPTQKDEELRPQISHEEEEEYDDEEVIVRGFSGNATRTERGIKFLGKRLARFVLSMTYPDQPFLPTVKSATESIAGAFKPEPVDKTDKPAHKHSTIHLPKHHGPDRAFQITSISFIGHSLGGLVQTYAIAYIQKHSPQFFTLIRPINFITLASPLLGLSNENPLYVKFALDFGLVGRTGQDLGLTWRAPTIARSGWGAIVGTLGESAHKKVMGEVQPESKPLLRILPTGPAHVALKKFRNRTVYSNVVNDGIVPLRTSCLLFLDWQGLGRVEKARREAGLMESVIGFGWAELTGANVTSPRRGPWAPLEGEQGHQQQGPSISTVSSEPSTPPEHATEVPQPAENATVEDDTHSLNIATPYHENPPPLSTSETHNNEGPLSGFLSFFKSKEAPQPPPPKSPRPSSSKESKVFKRSQTLKLENDSASSSRSKVSTGHELEASQQSNMSAPPKTSFFESAGDILNPKIPPMEYLIDPSKRPRTIFHDRVYHPSDIPSPPLKKRPTGTLAMRKKSNSRSLSSSKTKTASQIERNDSTSSSPYETTKPGVAHQASTLSTQDYDDLLHTSPDHDPDEVIDSSNMSVEEKIARAYHKGLSWRKVLVKLEPDAHNNIIVRRMFANAHGWPVVKHLVDSHFSDAAAARVPDQKEQNDERAKPMEQNPDETGAETTTQAQPQNQIKTGDGADETPRRQEEDAPDIHPQRPQGAVHSVSEAREADDAVPDLPHPSASMHSTVSYEPRESPSSPPRPSYDRLDSVTWSDRDWADSGDESEDADNHLAYSNKKSSSEEKGKEIERSGSPAWNWTEKIVGKGVGKGKQSPVQQGPRSPVEEGADLPRP
ncbi:lipase ROG1 [Seiridium cupressi]